MAAIRNWTPRKIKWIFFDVGETLVDETLPIHNSINQFVQFANELGYFITFDQVSAGFIDQYQQLDQHPMRTVMERLVESETDREFIRSRMKYRKDLDEPFPAARSVLEKLSQHYKIGIIANQSLGTEARLEQYGLLPFLSLICASAEAGFAKPDIRLYQKALEEAGCQPEQAIMVGDRIDNDILPAHSLGMQTLWVRQGYARNQNLSCHGDLPDQTVERLEDIPALFE
ncbi:HAD family hydrolase [Paenibacillus solisilvae]|uniref:HAD family hydrolase n=1 Tax=Paenibacillus solisilvae TaxID=2486751 RepID=A0ABW0VZS9_9BACL